MKNMSKLNWNCRLGGGGGAETVGESQNRLLAGLCFESESRSACDRNYGRKLWQVGSVACALTLDHSRTLTVTVCHTQASFIRLSKVNYINISDHPLYYCIYCIFSFTFTFHCPWCYFVISIRCPYALLDERVTVRPDPLVECFTRSRRRVKHPKRDQKCKPRHNLENVIFHSPGSLPVNSYTFRPRILGPHRFFNIYMSHFHALSPLLYYAAKEKQRVVLSSPLEATSFKPSGLSHMVTCWGGSGQCRRVGSLLGVHPKELQPFGAVQFRGLRNLGQFFCIRFSIRTL